MKQSITHHLSRDGALFIATDALKSYEKKYAEHQPKIRWLTRYEAEISFQVKGLKLNGSIEIDMHKIWLDMDIPFFLLPFKQQALAVIHSEISQWLKTADMAAASQA